MRVAFGIPLHEIAEEFKQEFNDRLLSGNLRKCYMISILGSFFVFPLIYLDIIRYNKGLLNNPVSIGITISHTFFILFIPIVAFIFAKRKTIFIKKSRLKRFLVVLITLILSVSLLSMSFLGIKNTGTISVYSIFIMLINFVINIEHRWRLLINLICVFLFVISNILFIENIVDMITNILECLGVSTPAFAFATFHYNAKIKEFTNAKLLKLERERSQKLLLNILPQQIAEELLLNGVSKPTFHEASTVLFTDFIGFSSKTIGVEPTLLTEVLNDYFIAFDDICKRHQLEKIKTIGDAYMAVCGVPIANQDHAKNCILAALEMIEYVKKYEHKALMNNALWFKMRVGLHSGSLVAGVVGKEKFSFDIWGETVNITARFEQKSESNRINISSTTFDLIRHDFECDYRGKIDIKNIGEVDMYFVRDV